MQIRYEEITKSNLEIIKKLQREIFPATSFEDGFDLFIEKGASFFQNEMQTYFIAYLDNVPVGIYGLYIPNGVNEHHSIWLGWYGIISSYRGKGIGKQILLDSMEKAKTYCDKYDIKYFRVYTSENQNPEGLPLYYKVMDMKEYYTHPEMFTDDKYVLARQAHPGKSKDEYTLMISKSIVIFSKSLFPNEILKPWNNYFLNITQTTEFEKKS